MGSSLKSNQDEFEDQKDHLTVNEKREFARFEFLKSVHVFPVSTTEPGVLDEIPKDSIESWADDMSEGGMRVEITRPLSLNLIYKIAFEFEKKQMVEVYGRIVWTRDSHAGIRFFLMEPDLRERIRALLERKKG